MEVGRWWLPGTRDGDAEPPLPRHPKFDTGYRAHNTNVYPAAPRPGLHRVPGRRGHRARHLGHGPPEDGGRWDYHPPMPGFCHTVLPLFEPGLLVVSDESIKDGAVDWPKLVWVVDSHVETKPVPIATCPLPPLKKFARRGGRFGAHNLHENRPGPGIWHSEKIVVGTFFNGGVRAFDLSDPFRPVEVAYAVPPAPRKSPPEGHPAQRRPRGRPRRALHRRSHDRRALRVRAEGVGLVSRGGTRPSDRGRALSAPVRARRTAAWRRGSGGGSGTPGAG